MRESLGVSVRRRDGSHERDQELLVDAETRLSRHVPLHQRRASEQVHRGVHDAAQPARAGHDRHDGRDGGQDGREEIDLRGADRGAGSWCSGQLRSYPLKAGAGTFRKSVRKSSRTRLPR